MTAQTAVGGGDQTQCEVHALALCISAKRCAMRTLFATVILVPSEIELTDRRAAYDRDEPKPFYSGHGG